LVEKAAAGEEIVIAKAGRPIARLVPIDHAVQRKPGLATGRVTDAFFEPLDQDDLAAWDQ